VVALLMLFAFVNYIAVFFKMKKTFADREVSASNTKSA
jgi:hypothetical protein